MNILQKIALVFTIIGGITWGVIGIFDFNIVDYIFMSNTVATRVVYSIVGICALFNLILLFLRFERHDD